MPHKKMPSNRASGTRAQATDLRLGRMVRLLMDHATVVASGTKIAQEIGGSRSEVWRLIQQLRGLGVDVTGHPATGYQLRSVPDLLLPDFLRPMVQGTRFAEQIRHFFKVGSTNAEAMAAAAADAPEGSVFLAEEQTAGRGRAAHVWQSARSEGVYCSIVLRPAMAPSDALVLSLAAGLAVRSAIQEIDEKISLDLKWPNDILIDGKKVCGILTEMNAEATRVRYVVVGVGINVNQKSFPTELADQATSLLLASGTVWSRVELTGILLKSLDREYCGLLEDPSARQSILSRFQEFSSSVRKQPVRVEENGHAFEGVTEGLDERGFLRIRTDRGLQTVLSGTVRNIKP